MGGALIDSGGSYPFTGGMATHACGFIPVGDGGVYGDGRMDLREDEADGPFSFNFGGQRCLGISNGLIASRLAVGSV